MPAPLASNASSSSAIGNLLVPGGQAAAGADQVRAQLQALAGQISSIGQEVDAIAADFPNAQQEVAQVKALLKQIVVKVAQQSPDSTASGSAVPTGGTVGPNP